MGNVKARGQIAPTPKAGRRRGRPSQTHEEFEHKRTEIAAIAQTLFAEYGYSAVSIRRVADASGVTPMTIYRYFDAKIDLLRFLWAGVFDDLFTQLELVTTRKASSHARLRNVARRYVRYWLDHPDHYRMVFMSEGVSQPDVSVFIADDDIGSKFQLFFRCAADAEPTAGKKDLLLKTQLLLCSLHGIAHSHITISGYDWLAAERLVDSLIASLFPLTKQVRNAV